MEWEEWVKEAGKGRKCQQLLGESLNFKATPRTPSLRLATLLARAGGAGVAGGPASHSGSPGSRLPSPLPTPTPGAPSPSLPVFALSRHPLLLPLRGSVPTLLPTPRLSRLPRFPHSLSQFPPSLGGFVFSSPFLCLPLRPKIWIVFATVGHGFSVLECIGGAGVGRILHHLLS